MKRYRPPVRPVPEIALVDVAPRLARAREDWVEHRRAIGRRRLRLIRALTNQQALLAHRELQSVRALRTRDRKYMAERDRKLAVTRGHVERITGLLRQLDEEE